jgi:hypothetical protein
VRPAKLVTSGVVPASPDWHFYAAMALARLAAIDHFVNRFW